MNDTLGARDYDWWLLAIVAAICTLGVIEIYSATHGSALAGMHMRQIRWLVIGTVLMFVFSRLDYHVILDQAPILYIIGIAGFSGCIACWPHPFWGQTVDPRPGRISSGVRTGQIDYNHSVGALLCGGAHG